VKRNMPTNNRTFRAGVAWIIAGAIFLSLPLACSCSKKAKDDGLVLREDIYGFFLGQSKDAVFKRAEHIAKITKAPEPPLGYRGDLYDFSAPLEANPAVQRVRCAFFEDRLVEVVVYFRNTELQNLEWLRMQLEGRYQTNAIAEDGKLEMAQKTYRLAGPGMSITIRRITKRDTTELYVQYLHDELHKRLIEKNRTVDRK
jgi:hypothetical protein